MGFAIAEANWCKRALAYCENASARVCMPVARIRQFVHVINRSVSASDEKLLRERALYTQELWLRGSKSCLAPAGRRIYAGADRHTIACKEWW